MDSMPTVDPCLSQYPGSPERPGAAAVLAAALLGLVVAGCERTIPLQSAEYYVFGTRVEVQVRDTEETTAQRAFERLGRDFSRMHDEWHPWNPGALATINRELPDGGWVRATPDIIKLLEASQEMEERSGGRFNAGLGALVRLWGFHTSTYPITTPPPEDEAIGAIMARRPSARDVSIDGEQIRSSNRAVRLDFSGIAKGLAVSQACDRLSEFRITDAMVNAGGDVMVCGPTDQPWQVGIRDPSGGVIGAVEVSQPVALFTSGNYQRFGEWEGERYAHIIDPFSGRPVDSVMQATVIHSDPLVADAAATALVVAGDELWDSVAASMGVDQALVIDEEGTIRTTEAAAYLLDGGQ